MSNEPGLGTRAAQLARLAARAAKIAAAASAGGPYGAAVETIRQFLPQIIKITAIALVVLMLIPVLIFAGIPHFLFGWMDNGSEDIADFTTKAKMTKATYALFDGSLNDAVQALIESVDTEGYDDVEVIQDTGSTNMEWMVAIIAVRFEQDVNIISPALILSAITDMLVLETVDTFGGILKIFVKDIGPEALMLRYGFTEEQKRWARVLAGNMADDQTLSDDDPDYTAGTDYGDITYTEGSTAVTYYNQTDSRWANMSYGYTGTIGGSGCGPTALAIAVSTLTGNAVTPVEASDWAARNGYYVEGVGSKHSLIPEGARHYGLSAEGIGNDGQKAVDALADGKLVIAIMSKGHFTSRGHFIVLRGVTADGKILVADPASVKRSKQPWDLELILSETNKGAGANGPLWVLG